MTSTQQYDAMFSGIIGQDYQMLKLICPYAIEMSRLVAEQVAGTQRPDTPLTVVELGGGTGITTLAILIAADNANVLSVDNEPTMQNQARQNLQEWSAQGRLRFSGADALTALRNLATASIDVLASAYTLHNFPADYRIQVLQEAYRVLVPGGRFINGDRYALDDIVTHTRNTQHEVAGYFKVLTDMQRLDLLEHWIIHLFSDESENYIMREAEARRQMVAAGFQHIKIHQRLDVNALLTAEK
ncbi:class I SAM-dependent methyltransferase [Methylomonas paludis]|uniref:Class I SAM-dependent methyltransferase n=1 Tax=Methylomonas paludis TaxID=1173101 RepID=A0A975MPD6_9GAMM|nr:class I SAM-dependent methyltransferase [Methylomonas paludis]QWF71588.1 class I SAM-dependent methyltransferase [Methylomonas paludis]